MNMLRRELTLLEKKMVLPGELLTTSLFYVSAV